MHPPQWLGFALATDKQIASGSAPFVYNYMPHDNQLCITAKSMFNTAHSAMYTPDTVVRSHPASSIVQGSLLSTHEKIVHDVCTPSFHVDYNSLGIPAPSFTFT